MTFLFVDIGAVSVNAAIYDPCSTLLGVYDFFKISNLCFVALFFNKHDVFLFFLLMQTKFKGTFSS